MSADDRIRYHLREYEIAQNASRKEHSLPTLSDSDLVILDIGCGIGQTLKVVGRDAPRRVLVGIDVDTQSLEFGATRFPEVVLINADAEQLPFPDASFDFVLSRVTLLYTDLNTSFMEIHRVLKPGGRFWATFHPWSTVVNKHLVKSIKNMNVKGVVFNLYTLANGLSFHLFQRQFRFPILHKMESFQTERGLRLTLAQAGFTEIHVQTGHPFLATAAKQANAVRQAG